MESGPAEVSGQCRRHESREGVGLGGVESMREGFSPLIRGFRGSPPRNFLNYRRLYVRFNAFWGARISVILAKNLASLT